MNISENVEYEVLAAIKKDLEPSGIAVLLKSGVSVFMGGFLSLLICGQFGLGMTVFATKANHHVHSTTNELVCMLVCGVFFAIFPAILLRFMSTGVHFRVLTRNRWQPTVLWIFVFGGGLAFHGSLGSDFFYFGIWAVSALTSFKAIATVIDRAVPRFQLYS